MRDPYQIVKRPLLTEKSDFLRERSSQYCFEVALEANKDDVKRAVETLFKVKVTAVRLQNRLGKTKRMGRFIGRRANWKKAFVSLAAGNTIELYEGI
ncbi:MAG TPA: 50S ribosomal protein L23 [Candidatus Glassbacteria bacterium]|nr:50S ribosomal protein L23 [Candidatus Glassbacteria bacterium]